MGMLLLLCGGVCMKCFSEYSIKRLLFHVKYAYNKHTKSCFMFGGKIFIPDTNRLPGLCPVAW